MTVNDINTPKKAESTPRQALERIRGWFTRRAEIRGRRRDLWQAYVAMIGAMEAAGYPYQADGYALWRAFIGFGEGYLEYVHPDRYGWSPHERPLYDRLKSTTETYRSLRSDFQRLGLALPTFGFSLMRDAGTVRMVPTRGRWAL